jgi:hypothetical protein
MSNEILKNCEIITKMTQEMQNRTIRIFARLDAKTKIVIFQEQKVIFHKIRNVYLDLDNSLLSYSSFVLATQKIAEKANINAIKLRSSSTKEKSQKREKLLSYWSLIKTLKLDENLSFREISTYLTKYHKFEVSYSLVHKTWNEIQNNLIKKMEN